MICYSLPRDLEALTFNKYLLMTYKSIYIKISPVHGRNQNLTYPWLNVQWNDAPCSLSLYALCDAFTQNPNTETMSPTTSSFNNTMDRFTLVNESMNFLSAETYCQQHHGTHPATIQTTREKDIAQ